MSATLNASTLLAVPLAPLVGSALAGIFGTQFGGNWIGRKLSHSLTILGVLVAFIGLDVVTATPRFTFGNVNLMGGKGIVRDHVFEAAKEWMRGFGATKAQCWAKGTLVQMYEKMGMTNTHQVMRINL